MKLSAITLIILITIIPGCAKCFLNNSGGPSPDYEISVNENFQIELKSNPTTGYSWQWENKQLVSIVDTFDHRYIPDQPVLIGSGGKEVWKFKGVKSGTDSIKLKYCRSWAPNSTVNTRVIIVKVK